MFLVFALDLKGDIDVPIITAHFADADLKLQL
jgi:hypothetical protein